MPLGEIRSKIHALLLKHCFFSLFFIFSSLAGKLLPLFLRNKLRVYLGGSHHNRMCRSRRDRSAGALASRFD